MSDIRRRRHPAALVLAGAAATTTLVSLVVAAPASAASVGTVTGIVVDDTGAAVAGLVVSGRTGANAVIATARTAADGTYRLQVAAGSRAVCFDGTGLSTASGGYSFTCFGGPTAATATVVRVTADQVRGAVNGTVTRRAVVKGRVIDRAGPVAGVVVQVQGAADSRTTTDADGRYRVVVDPVAVPTTSVWFQGANGTGAASSVGYVDAYSGEVHLAPGTVAVVGKTVTPGAAAAGRVVDSAGQPVADAQVVLPGRTVRTGANGTWRATGAPAGPVSIAVIPPAEARGPHDQGLLPRCVDGSAYDENLNECPDETPTRLVAGQVTGGLRTTLPDASALSGRVTDNLGTPIPGVTILLARINSRFIEATTDAQGNWIARGLTPLQYSVCSVVDWFPVTAPDPDGYSDSCLPDRFTLGADESRDTGTLELTGRGRVVGRVVDAVTGRGLAGVAVAVAVTGQRPTRVVTAADGSYVLGGVTAGQNGICATPTDAVPSPPPLGYAGSCPAQYLPDVYLRDPQMFLVQDRGDTTVPTIALVQNATVGGRITDRAGFPLRGVRVVVTDTGDVDAVPDEFTTGADGRWVSSPIKPATVTVCFQGQAAVRANDGTHPAAGYADQCWNGGAQPTPVTLSPGQQKTGINAVLAPRTSG